MSENNTATLSYKGFIGSIEFRINEGILWGKVLGIPDSITYKGTTIAEITKEFKEEIDDFISICEEYKRSIPKPFKGSLNVRIGHKNHRYAVIIAKEKGISVNEYIKISVEKNISTENKEIAKILV